MGTFLNSLFLRHKQNKTDLEKRIIGIQNYFSLLFGVVYNYKEIKFKVFIGNSFIYRLS